jgi:hypothetical protein
MLEINKDADYLMKKSYYREIDPVNLEIDELTRAASLSTETSHPTKKEHSV